MVEPQRIRNPDWKEDEQLKEDLKRYVLQNLSRQAILDFVSRDYAQYAWSLGTLSRRLAFFNVKYVDYNTDINVVQDAVQILPRLSFHAAQDTGTTQSSCTSQFSIRYDGLFRSRGP